MNDWQKIIFLNYGWVENELIDEILSAPRGTTKTEAERMGLSVLPYDPPIKKRAFVTIIRNNWDFLPLKSIAKLLEKTENELNELLRDYDFLGIKLGEKVKGNDYVHYSPLTPSEEANTSALRKFVEEKAVSPVKRPFDFYEDDVLPAAIKNGRGIKDRFVASYDANYSSALDDDELKDYSEAYLARLQKAGTTGIWLHETLRRLAEFPFDKLLSDGYEKRIKNLCALTKRCAKYGIGVYLYLNEPRSLDGAFFKTRENLRGQDALDGTFILCTSAPDVRNYLYDAVKSIGKNVPELAGIMTITMSENPTNCYCKPWNGKYRKTDCPRCKGRLPEEVCAEINNVMCKALRDSGAETRLIANVWGWSEFMGWSEENTLHGIDLLDKDVDVLSVSEYGKKFTRGGIEAQVVDYSVSVVGPSEITTKVLSKAKQNGHRIWAKIQVNNSWECSAVPYIPAFDLMLSHIRNLKKLGVSGLMMGWSLGGFPGGALPICNILCGGTEKDAENWCKKAYGTAYKTVKKCSAVFSEAFKEFPFSVDSLYYGGQTLGPANEVTSAPQNRESTMVCFTFDDYETYTKPYGIDVYLSQYEKLIEKWKIGIEMLLAVSGNSLFESFKRVARASLVQFESSYLVAKVAKFKRLENGKETVCEAIKRLNELSEELLLLMSEDATIGFEMTNHYFYNQNLILFRMWERSFYINTQATFLP